MTIIKIGQLEKTGQSHTESSMQKAWREVAKCADHRDLAGNVRRLFEILDQREETDSGTEFSPIQISSVRVILTHELESLFKKLKEQAEYKKE